MADENEQRFGVRLRGGLPSSNGLTPRAEELCDETTSVVFGVVSMRVAAVTHSIEKDTRTASMALLGVECQLTPEEVDTVKLIMDRARVRRTGQAPLFDNADMPENPRALLSAVPDGPAPAKKTTRPRRRGGNSS